MNAVDTNVLIYAHDPREPIKRAIALSLINSLSDGVLLWQVASEFLWASRKLAPFGYSQTQAWQEIRKLRKAWKTIVPTWMVMDLAEDLLGRFSLSYWDALLISACIDAGVSCLYSEDFDAYSQIDGLSLVNPFKTP